MGLRIIGFHANMNRAMLDINTAETAGTVVQVPRDLKHAYALNRHSVDRGEDSPHPCRIRVGVTDDARTLSFKKRILR